MIGFFSDKGDKKSYSRQGKVKLKWGSLTALPPRIHIWNAAFLVQVQECYQYLYD